MIIDKREIIIIIIIGKRIFDSILLSKFIFPK